MGTRFDSETRPDRTAPKDTVTALEPRTESSAAAPSDLRGTIRSYVALTKPRIIELLLVTTFPTMFLAQRGVPSLWLIVATLVGGTLSAASANTLNCYLDRDIDKVMHRTENRPLVTGAISPAAALRFGVVLGVLSSLWLGLLVNWLSAALSLGAIVLYVGFYTMLLKRRTSQNIVWGGVAGCMPVLIGWSAVTDSLSWSALVLFMIIFFWTPPHYWPLSMRFKDEYEAAGVPMLPVVAKDSLGRAPGRPLQLGGARHVAGAGAGRRHGLDLPRRRRRRRRGVPARGLPAARPGQGAGERHDRLAEADAAVPLLDQLPHAALPRRRDRPDPAPAALSGGPGRADGRWWASTHSHKERLMPTRTARTAWTGTLQEGSGQVELSSSHVGTYDVSFPKRAAEDAGGTTSPEELIAAAHSSCFAMQLSALVAEAGGTPQSLEVRPTSPSARTGRAGSASPASPWPCAGEVEGWTPTGSPGRRRRPRRPAR